MNKIFTLKGDEPKKPKLNLPHSMGNVEIAYIYDVDSSLFDYHFADPETVKGLMDMGLLDLFWDTFPENMDHNFDFVFRRGVLTLHDFRWEWESEFNEYTLSAHIYPVWNYSATSQREITP